MDNEKDFQEQLNKIKKHSLPKRFNPKSLLDGVEEIRQDLEECTAEGDVKFGIEILDDCVETIRKGSVTFIVAGANTGKSLLALNIASNLSKQGKDVLYCSCEMGAGLLMERQLRHLTGINMVTLKDLYRSQRDTANNILDSIIVDKNYNYLQHIFISETGGATVEDLLAMFECYNDFEYIIVDYIQRVRGSGTDYENITNATRELQTYARNSGKKLIICSQANRQSRDEARYGKQVDTGKIRAKGSGSIEEDADVGLSLMEIEEDGKTKILATLFKNRYTQFKNISYKYHIDSRLNFVLEDKGG